jgi:hypothetical protein
MSSSEQASERRSSWPPTPYLDLLSHGLVWLALAALLLRKMLYIQDSLGARAGCARCLWLPVLQHDAVVFGALLLLYAASSWVASKLLGAALRIVFLSFAVVYAIDVVIIARFSTRLFLGDAQEMSGEIRSAYTLIRTALSGATEGGATAPAAMAIGVVVVLALVGRFVAGDVPLPRAARATMLAAAASLVGFRFLPLRYAYVSSWMYENVFELNRGMGIDRPYPEAFKQELRASFRDPPICAPGRGVRPNVILLVVEALSSYQSRHFSGLHDHTPELDEIAQRNTSLLEFHANGFRTTGGMIALVAGQFPLPAIGGFRRATAGGTSFEGFDLGRTLPRRLAAHGYTSYYLTTCDLEFSDLGSWMRAAGFDAVEGNRAAEFDGWPRFQFDAPPDEALYAAALSRLAASTFREPFLLVLATTSSHLPWRSPAGAEHTEQGVMRYVDRQIGAFHDALERIGFLENDMLIITSDHRQMTPVSATELRRFGDAAPAMIPLVIAWKSGGLPERIDGAWQQVDLGASLESLVAPSACRSSYQGSFLALRPSPPPCVLHVQGDDRDMLYARCGDERGAIKMDGPRTRLVRGELREERFLIDKIHHDRALR